ncbi:type IV secretory system conjugative DNA transfer family protein [Fusobacterium sp. PH5-44]|uniref:type IV secretory system conjugative DNA transfer family protein n=1 Tax=unclassified Fusobacterium TaxID=2648384 RepID=UPI003D191AB4
MKLKKKTKLIFLLIGLLFALTAATQTFAKYTGHNKILKGSTFKGKKVYFPLKIIFWYPKYAKYAPVAAEKAFASFGFTMLFFLFSLGMLTKQKKKLDSHGTSSFAEKEDIEKMDLLPTRDQIMKNYVHSGVVELYQAKITFEEDFWVDGAFVGRDQWGRDLLDLSPHPLIAVAPTRGGKGVSVVITTLLTWKGSIVVNDIKGENWQLTSAYRRSIGQKVMKFKPTDLNSCHYNPLLEVRKGTVYELQDTRNIAEIIVSPDPQKDPFFGPQAVNMLTGLILHVLYIVEDRCASLTDVYNFINSPSMNDDEMFQSMTTVEHNPDGAENFFFDIYRDVVTSDGEKRPRVHPQVAKIAAQYLPPISENTRSGIKASVLTNLEVFATPTIARNIQDSDFRVADLMNHEYPVSLYFVTPPSDIPITGVLMKILLTQIIYINTKEMSFSADGQNTNYKHRLMLLIDEFPTLGRMDLLHRGLAFVAGYGIKPFLICQDIAQLNSIYGENNSIASNCRVDIYYTPNETKTAKIISEQLGDKTITKINKSWSGIKWFSKWNYSESEMARKLMTPAEITQMSGDRTLIFVTGQKPIFGIKARWYQEEKFKRRQKIGAFVDESDSLYR